MSDNPYQPPPLPESEGSVSRQEIAVFFFGVDPAGNRLPPESAPEISALLREGIIERLEQRGLAVAAEPNAPIRLRGVIRELDPGNQLLRYLVPFLAGATTVRVEGRIEIVGREVVGFQETRRAYAGAFGGQGNRMIRNSLRRIALEIAAKIERLVRPESSVSTANLSRYFLCLGGLVVIGALLLGGAGAAWASTLPRTNDAIKSAEVPIWALVVAASSATSGFLLGLGAAPKQILDHPSMGWLHSISGTRSLVGTRIVVLLLALVAGGVCGACFWVAAG